MPSQPSSAVERFGRPLVFDGTFQQGRPSCQSAFDQALEAGSAEEFFDALDSAKLWGGPWADQVSRMSIDLRALRLAEDLRSTIDYPAGILDGQMFADHALELLRWLHDHGAPEAAQCVAELIAVFPRGRPIVHAERRENFLSSFASENPDRFDEIANKYARIVEHLVAPFRTLLQIRGSELAVECEHLRTEFAEPMPRTLEEIVGIPDDLEFRTALVRWLDAPAGSPTLGFDRQPEVGRMLWVLEALAVSAEVDGMTHFLNSAGVGESFGKLAGWAKKVGATNTREYANAAAAQLKRLNGGKLPSMKDGPRQTAIRRLEEKDEASGGRGLFDALDEEYGQLVSAELAAKIRAYITEHRGDVERSILENASR
jgi:hypothetical protein